MPFDRARWQEQVRRWWREHAPQLPRAAAAFGIQGSYALLVASAFAPLLAMSPTPQALSATLAAIAGNVGAGLLANVLQGARDGALQRLAAGAKEPEVRAALDHVVDQAQAVDAASEALGPQWETFAKDVLAELARIGGSSTTSATIERILQVAARPAVAIDSVQQGGVLIKDCQVTIQVGSLPDAARVLSQAGRLQDRRDSRIEGLPRRAAVRVTAGSDGQTVAHESFAAALPARGRKRWLQRQALGAAFKKWETEFVPLAGAERLPVDVALIKLEGDGPQQRRVRETLPDVRAAFDRHERFVLLGDPGGGKTTVLQRLALEGFQEAARDRRARVPFFVELGAHKQGTPAAFLAERWQAQGYADGLGASLPEMLARGQILFLADGLNEMPRERLAEQMDGWRGWVHDVNQCPPGNHVVFACRTLEYAQPLELPQVEVLPFAPERVQQFLELCLPPAAAGKLWDRLQADDLECQAAAHAERSLLGLVGNPFVLHALVEVYRNAGDLPRNRGQLFAAFVLSLLDRQSRHVRRLKESTPETREDARRFPQALGQLAFALQREGEARRFSQARAMATLPGEPPPAGVLEHALGAGILRQHEELAGVELAFTHQLLQEACAAQELLRRLRAGEDLQPLWQAIRLAEAMPPVTGQGEWDPLPPPPATGWEETTILAAGLAGGDLPKLLDAVRATYPALAARCLDECGLEQPAPAAVRAAVQKQLLADLRDPRIHLRARLEAGWRLGRIGDPRFTPVRSREGTDYVRPGLCRVEAGRYLVGNPADPADPRHDTGAYADEANGAEVELPTYWIARYPVTNAEYRLFVQAGGYAGDTWWQGAVARRWQAGELLGAFADYLEQQRWAKSQPTDWRQRWAAEFRPQELDSLAWMREHSEEDLLGLLRRQFGEQRRDQPAYWADPAYSGWVGDNQPVIGVCWYEARAYCAWLQACWSSDRFAGAPDGIPASYEVRLPNEAEWEAAARGAEGRRYPGEGEFDAARANTLEGRVLRVSPVGAYPEGGPRCGALEMSGNVWEWTLSLWGSRAGQPDFAYPYRAGDGREDVAAGSDVLRVVRGGSCNNNQRDARCASRDRNNPDLRYNLLGFRVVVAPPISPGS